MTYFKNLMRIICFFSAAMTSHFLSEAKDYTVTIAKDVDVVYAVNTTDLIARVKRVKNYSSRVLSKIEVPKTIKYTTGGKTYTLTVTKIGDGAFDDVEVKTVTLPSTITHIGNDAFNFSSVEKINLPAGLVAIGDRAFYATDLNSVTIPGSCKTIGNQAFANCSMRTLKFEESNTPLTIGEKAFTFVSIYSLTLPARVKTLGAGAFEDCRWVQTVDIMSQLSSIPDNCFNYRIALTRIGLPASITSIGNSAFYECWNLSEFPMLPNLNTIGENAFMKAGLTAIKFPEGLLSIGKCAFKDNESLSQVSFPSTLQRISANAFDGCNELSRVDCDAVVPPVMEMPCFSCDCSKVPAFVPTNSISAYKTAQGWKLFDYGHYNPSSVTDVEISDPASETVWYDLNGRILESKPETPGIYIKVSEGKAAKIAI